jgi:hypothetical protein
VHSCCNDQSCSACFEDYPPHTHTHTHISYPTTCSYVKKIRPLANHNDFVSGRFLAEKTYLVGTRIFEYCEKIKYEIANLLVMVIISLRSFSSNPTAEDQTNVTTSSS